MENCASQKNTALLRQPSLLDRYYRRTTAAELARSISWFNIAVGCCCTSRVSGFCTYCGYCQVLAAFICPLVLRVLGSTKILPICAENWEYDVHTLWPSVHRLNTFIPNMVQKKSYGWPHEWELEQVTFGGGNWSI